MAAGLCSMCKLRCQLQNGDTIGNTISVIVARKLYLSELNEDRKAEEVVRITDLVRSGAWEARMGGNTSKISSLIIFREQHG